MGQFTRFVKLIMKAWYYKDNPKVRHIWLRLQGIWADIEELYILLNEVLTELKEEE